MSQYPQLLCKALYGVYYLFDEDLKDGIWSSETLAILVAKLLIVIILAFEDELSGVTLPLIYKIAVNLLAVTNSTLIDVLVAFLLWQYIILILNDEFYILCEVLVEPVELW